MVDGPRTRRIRIVDARDGEGDDRASFDTFGSEHLIKVKSTAPGGLTLLLTTRRKVHVADECTEQHRLYRVVKLRALESASRTLCPVTKNSQQVPERRLAMRVVQR